MNKDIEVIEELLLNAIPSQRTILLNGWIVRLNGGYTYRANCICPLYYKAERNNLEQLHMCEEIMKLNRIPPIVKLTPELQGDLEKLLLSNGYSKVKTVYSMTKELENINLRLSEELECKEFADKEWLKASVRLSGVTDCDMQELHSSGISNISNKTIFVKVRKDGEVIACAYGTVERGYVGIYDLHVDEAYRCRGLGTAICNAIMRFGIENGANKAYLIVHSKNQNAIQLYKKMEFQILYSYDFYQFMDCSYKIIDA